MMVNADCHKSLVGLHMHERTEINFDKIHLLLKVLCCRTHTHLSSEVHHVFLWLPVCYLLICVTFNYQGQYVPKVSCLAVLLIK